MDRRSFALEFGAGIGSLAGLGSLPSPKTSLSYQYTYPDVAAVYATNLLRVTRGSDIFTPAQQLAGQVLQATAYGVQGLFAAIPEIIRSVERNTLELAPHVDELAEIEGLASEEELPDFANVFRVAPVVLEAGLRRWEETGDEVAVQLPPTEVRCIVDCLENSIPCIGEPLAKVGIKCAFESLSGRLFGKTGIVAMFFVCLIAEAPGLVADLSVDCLPDLRRCMLACF